MGLLNRVAGKVLRYLDFVKNRVEFYLRPLESLVIKFFRARSLKQTRLLGSVFALVLMLGLAGLLYSNFKQSYSLDQQALNLITDKTIAAEKIAEDAKSFTYNREADEKKVARKSMIVDGAADATGK